MIKQSNNKIWKEIHEFLLNEKSYESARKGVFVLGPFNDEPHPIITYATKYHFILTKYGVYMCPNSGDFDSVFGEYPQLNWILDEKEYCVNSHLNPFNRFYNVFLGLGNYRRNYDKYLHRLEKKIIDSRNNRKVMKIDKLINEMEDDDNTC